MRGEGQGQGVHGEYADYLVTINFFCTTIYNSAADPKGITLQIDPTRAHPQASPVRTVPLLLDLWAGWPPPDVAIREKKRRPS